MLSEDSFCAPANILEEIAEHAQELAEKMKMQKQTIPLLAETIILETGIHLVPLSEFKHQKENALNICPDKDDAEYFALALHLNCPIWSNDQKLKKQNKVRIITTKELINITNAQMQTKE